MKQQVSLLVLFIITYISNGYQVGFLTQILSLRRNEMKSRTNQASLHMAGESDAVERRKRRRGKVPFETISKPAAKQTAKETFSRAENEVATPSEVAKAASGTVQESLDSFEKLIGLKDDQLRDLMDLQLPVPQEDKSTGQVINDGEDGDSKVFRLPELKEFLRDTKDKDFRKEQDQPSDSLVPLNTPKVNRRNIEEYKTFLKYNPYADTDERYFQQEFDIIPSIFGTGKLLGIGLSYLQAGHLIFLFIALVSAFLYSPGNPLTDLPNEIRTFLKQGLLVVYSINLVLAIQAYFIAQKRNLPPKFWLVKTFLFGGLSFYEVQRTEDPTTYSAATTNDATTNNKTKNWNEKNQSRK